MLMGGGRLQELVALEVYSNYRPIGRGVMGALAPPPPPTDPRGPLFLADQPLPALLLPAFFSFLILCSETAPKHLLCRLLTDATDGLLPIYYKRGISGPFSLEGDCGMHCSFLCGPFGFEGCLKYKLFSVAKSSIHGTREALFTG